MKRSAEVDVIFLRHHLSHINIYSGYENFIKKLPLEDISYKEVFRLRSLKRTDIYRRFYITKRNKKKSNKIGPFYNVFSFLAEMETLKAVKQYHSKVVHNTFLEDNHGFLGNYKGKNKFSLIATTHQPLSWWKYLSKDVSCLNGLSLLVTVTSREQDYFEKLLPGRVRFVHHAVDTDFFTIKNEINKRPYRLLFVGNWLRDTQFFENVVSRIVQISKEIIIDIVYSIDMDIHNPIFKLCKYPQVTIHRFISNEQLLYLYNNSRLLFLPLKDSTANNSLLEALACGVPVVATDLPGIKDYTNSCIAHYYKNERDCQEFILGAIKDDALLKERSVAARNFMCSNFSLEQIAHKHGKMYREFT